MNDDTVQFVEEGGSYLLGIGFYCVKRNINVAIHARARSIIKGDDVGIIVVLQELAVYR